MMKKASLDTLTSDLDSWSGNRQPSLFLALVTGFVFWMGCIGLILWLGIGSARAEVGAGIPTSDPMVMKVYPDGTKVVLRWSEVGKSVDNGEKFGGAPRIVAYDPTKDGIVPIGQSSQKSSQPTNNPTMISPSSVVSPEQPQKMDYTDANPDEFQEYTPKEGFVFRSAVGASFQQPLSGSNADGTASIRTVFQPGIRFDLEPAFNITDWFSVGLESSFIYNPMHSLQVDNTIFYGPNGSGLGNGGFYQVPVMGKVRFQFPSESVIRGYVGASFGASWDVLQSSSLFGTYTSYTWNYAYGLTTGFTYNICKGLDFDLSYKLLATPNPCFSGDSSNFASSYNHSASFGLAWRF